MKPLDEMFSKDDIVKLIELSDRLLKPDEELEFEVEIETFDMEAVENLSPAQHAVFCMEHGFATSRLVARYGHMQLVISSTGDVSSQNWGDCRFPIRKPLEVYELVLRRMKPELFEEKMKG